jgi:hypothetical protein
VKACENNGAFGLCRQLLSSLHWHSFLRIRVVEDKVGSSRNHPNYTLLTKDVLLMTGLSLGRSSTIFQDETSLVDGQKSFYPQDPERKLILQPSNAILTCEARQTIRLVCSGWGLLSASQTYSDCLDYVRKLALASIAGRSAGRSPGRLKGNQT